MDITVTGRHTDVPEPVRKSAIEKISRLGRYLDGMDRADVVFLHERNPRISSKDTCEVTLQGHGHHVRAKVKAADQLAAVDLVVEKLEHQLTRLKKKLAVRPHHRNNHRPEDHAPEDLVDGLIEGAKLDGASLPRIVKSKRFDLQSMSPDEAVEHMELLGHEFYFFTHVDSGRAAIVYRRGDGDIGLIEGDS